MEEWRPIHGYIGLYEVSNLGRVKRLSRIVKVKNGYRAPLGYSFNVEDKILKTPLILGYPSVCLTKSNKEKTHKIHRLVARAFIGKSKLTVNHKDFNKKNNRLENLEYMSSADNTRHFNRSFKRNLPCGEKHHFCKMSDLQIKEAIALKGKMKQKDVATLFSVSEMFISRLFRGLQRQNQ